MSSERYDMADEEWYVLKQVLPTALRSPERKYDRKVMNGLFYRLRAKHLLAVMSEGVTVIVDKAYDTNDLLVQVGDMKGGGGGCDPVQIQSQGPELS